MIDSARPISRKDVLIALMILCAFLIQGVSTIGQYGLTWDEPENLVVGERYLAFFATLDASYLDMATPRPEVDNPDGLRLRLYDSHAHPPLPNIAVAICGRLFHRWLGWLDPVDARHVAVFVMAGLMLCVTYLYMPSGQIHIAMTVKDIWLPQDIRLVESGIIPTGAGYVMHTTRPAEYAAFDLYARDNLNPVYSVQRDGAAIMEIYPMSAEAWRLGLEYSACQLEARKQLAMAMQSALGAAR